MAAVRTPVEVSQFARVVDSCHNFAGRSVNYAKSLIHVGVVDEWGRGDCGNQMAAIRAPVHLTG